MQSKNGTKFSTVANLSRIMLHKLNSEDAAKTSIQVYKEFLQ